MRDVAREVQCFSDFEFSENGSKDDFGTGYRSNPRLAIMIGSACHPFRQFYSLADAALLLMLPFAASRFSQVL